VMVTPIKITSSHCNILGRIYSLRRLTDQNPLISDNLGVN
jgi:hypothetical protein